MRNFTNAQGQVIAFDSGSNQWRVYDTTAQTFGAVATAPAVGQAFNADLPASPSLVLNNAQPNQQGNQAQRPPRSPATPWTQREKGLGIAAAVLGCLVLLSVLVYSTGPNRQAAGGQQQAGNQQVTPSAVPSRSPFIEAAPAGHKFVGATKGTDGASCEERGGQVVPDKSKPMVQTAKGWARPNKCTADS